MIETVIGLAFGLIAIAMAWQANKEHIDATGVALPSSNARRRIRRNARRKGISEDQAYTEWLAWHQKRAGVSGSRFSSGIARTRAAGGIVGYTAADIARVQREAAARRPYERAEEARREEEEREQKANVGLKQNARQDAEARLRGLGASCAHPRDEGHQTNL